MIDIDGLTGEFEGFLERVRSKLDQEIAKAQKLVGALNTEKTATQSAIAKLADEHKQAQAQLDSVLSYLGRASGLASLENDIAKGHKELAAVKSETEKVKTALAGLVKQRGDEEGKLGMLRSEAQVVFEARRVATEMLGDIRQKFGLAR